MLVNKERLNLLKNDDSPEEKNWLEDLISGVMNDLEARMNTISNLEPTKINELISEFHKISGVSANFGLEELHRKASNSEKLLRNGKSDDALQDFGTTKKIWEDTKQELLDYQKNL